MQGKLPSPDVMTDAERWYARLKAPDCTASERMEFRRWQANAEHAAAYAQTELLWQSVGKLAGHPRLEQLSRQILADTSPQSRHHMRRRFAVAASAGAVSLIALTMGAVFWGLQQRKTSAVVYATKSGERSIIKLADGSQLVLNYASELDVRLGRDTRHVTLHKGEALFMVAHDETRPFKVDAGDGEVTALGTRFEVRSDAGHVAVTLLEGRVAVDRSNEKEHVQLEPGDQIRFTEAKPKMIRRTVDPEVVSSWSTDRLRFRATPLVEALDEVNRYSTTQIRIADPTLASTPISGTFEVGDTASVVAALTALLPIQAAEKDGEVQLRRRD
jgi:transmembrane sensor